jgi:hypothetical protein
VRYGNSRDLDYSTVISDELVAYKCIYLVIIFHMLRKHIEKSLLMKISLALSTICLFLILCMIHIQALCCFDGVALLVTG